VTGGGLPGNIPRVLPPGLTATVDARSWIPPQIFTLIEQQGRVDKVEMFATFNMGIGFVLVVPAGTEPEIISLAEENGHSGSVIGRIDEGEEFRLVV
jgi:phosphoribosylformylglycinamidine cyclo-ligase